MILLTKEDRENLIVEYEELLKEILQRRQNMWLIHSILLASTFIISFTSNQNTLPFPYIVSLFLVIISWSIERTNVTVNNSCWDRRHEIEDLLGMKGPERRFERLRKTWSYRIRNILWDLIYVFLIFTYTILLSPYIVIGLRDIFTVLL